jgi:hypothetical protein
LSITLPSAKRSIRIFGPVAAEPPGRCAHRVRAFDLRSRIAVRKIQPDHVDTGREQRVEHARRISGRAERGEDLGAAERGGHRRNPVQIH